MVYSTALWWDPSWGDSLSSSCLFLPIKGILGEFYLWMSVLGPRMSYVSDFKALGGLKVRPRVDINSVMLNSDQTRDVR